MRAAGVSDLVALAAGESDDRRRLYEGVADLLEIARRRAAGRAGRRGPALGRPLHPRAPHLPRTGAPRRRRPHRRHLPVRRAAPTPPAPTLRRRAGAQRRPDRPRPARPGRRHRPARPTCWAVHRPTDEATRLYERSDGNPFLLEELTACSLQGGLPQSLRELLLIRVDRLAPSTQQMLHIAPVSSASTCRTTCWPRWRPARIDIDDASLHGALREAVDAVDPGRGRSADGARRSTGTPSGTRCCASRSTSTCCPASTPRSTPRSRRPSPTSPRSSTSSRSTRRSRTTGTPRTTCRARCPPPAAAAAAARQINAYAEQQRLLERVLELWSVVPGRRRAHRHRPVLTVVVDAALAASRADNGERVHRAQRPRRQSRRSPARSLGAASALARRGKWRLHTASDAGLADVQRALEILPEEPSELRARTLDALGVDPHAAR